MSLKQWHFPTMNIYQTHPKRPRTKPTNWNAGAGWGRLDVCTTLPLPGLNLFWKQMQVSWVSNWTHYIIPLWKQPEGSRVREGRKNRRQQKWIPYWYLLRRIPRQEKIHQPLNSPFSLPSPRHATDAWEKHQTGSKLDSPIKQLETPG